MEATEAERYAAQWAEEWNAHDLDALMRHFADDVVWTSPVAAAIVEGSGGVVCGKGALRSYYANGIKRTPDLHFEVLAVYRGVNSIVINYRNQRGGLVNEVLIFDDEGLVREGHGTYLG